MSSKRSDVVVAETIEESKPPRDRRRPVQIRTIEVGHQRLRVGVWKGIGRRPPLLLFNGIGTGFETLTPFAAALPDIETIAFDVPGAGESPAPLRPYRLWMMANLASRLLDNLGYGQVDALGVSWGGTLAQQFALQNPVRCRRLILAATVPSPMVPGRLSVLREFLTPRRMNDPDHLRAVGGHIYGGAVRIQPELSHGVTPAYGRVNKKGYLYQQLALLGWVSAFWLPLLTQKTLIMAGRDDPIVPLANARLLRLLIKRSRLEIYDDGHLFMISNAEAVSQTVESFLRE
jgi:poly(3-hydroxyoctanoate) depolymerase